MSPSTKISKKPNFLPEPKKQHISFLFRWLPRLRKPFSWLPQVGKLLIVFSVFVPAASLALIVSKGRDPSIRNFTGSFNGAPFALNLTFRPENPVEAVAKIRDEWVSKGARTVSESVLWQNLKKHPYIEAQFLSVLSGTVLQLPGKSLVAIFAMSPAGGGTGSQVGILQTRGPVTAVLEAAPGHPVMNIQLEHFLVRSYGNVDRKEILDGLEREGWTRLPGNRESRWVFSKQNWTSHLFRDENDVWSFFAFHSGSPRY